MVNAILAKRVNHIVTKGDNPAWPKGSKSRGFSSDKEYLLSIIYVSETTKQASPTTYEIQQDGSQYFIATASKRLYVDYDSAKDVLSISSLGDYLRN